MNHHAFQQFFKKLASLLVLVVLMFPTSLAAPLATLPAQAAPVSGLPETPPTPPTPGGLSNQTGAPPSAPVVVTSFTNITQPANLVTPSAPQPLFPLTGYPHLPFGYVSLGSFTAVGTVLFDTDALTYGGLPGGVVDSGNAVFAFSSINIPAGTTLRARGSRPLVLTTAGAVTINGTIDLNGTNSSPTAPSCQPGAVPNPGGAGGGAGGAGTAANPGVGLPGSGPGGGGAGPASSTPGAGGAGFGGNGGAGGGGGGAGGLTYGNLGVALQGGSGGGGASTNSGDGCQASAGAGGGGALLITAFGAIQIGGAGVVSANGGNGALSDLGAPGAGSGGALILFAPVVVNAGIVRANGGAGGAGGCCGGGGGGGGGRLLVVSSYSGAGSTSANGGAGGSAGSAGTAGAAGQVQTFAYGAGPGVFQADPTDLGITKSLISPVAPGVGIAGQEVIYQVDVHNFGPDVAVDAVVTDTLPADVIFMGATLPCSDNAGVLTCSLGAMAVGDSLSFQV